MPDIPPIDDLENLSATGAMLEGVLRQWVQEITECSPPDIVTFAEAVDFFARLTAIRKTLIKLSRLSKPRPNNSSPAPESKRSRATDLPSSPVDLPQPDIPQIRSLPDVPLDRIRPDLEAISTAFADGGLPIPDCKIPESAQSDQSAPRPDNNSPIRNPQSEIRKPFAPQANPPIRNPQSEIRNSPVPRRFG
ncbi:MAG: hypothetical protein ABFD69_02075 [Candidatus Sumerlaeia bacterium]